MVRLIIFLLATSMPAMACAWWAPEWSERKTIAVDTSAAGANTQSAISNAPVLVRLHAGNFPQFLSIRDGGADFRVVAADDATPLSYHVERFDPVSQIAMLWVSLPSLVAQAPAQNFYLYFGNPAAVSGGDAGATYDVDTAAVFHFAEATGMPLDSTAYKTTVGGSQPIANPASMIGGGILLTAAAPLVIDDAPHLALDPEKGWTVSTWIKFDNLPGTDEVLIDRQDGVQRLTLSANGDQLRASFAGAVVTSFTPLTPATWHHVALVVTAAQMQLYLDGAQVGGAAVQAQAMIGPIYVGSAVDGSGLLGAALDELKISRIARQADEIVFDAAVQGLRNDDVLTYGGDESAAAAGAEVAEGGHASHFNIILNNVFGRPDAIIEQAVILLCALMAAVAIMVMLIKAVALSRSRRATNRFLSAYRQGMNGGEAQLNALLAAEDDYDDSPLFSVYSRGLGEVRARLSPSVGAAVAGLEDKSLTAIRATLEAVIVREGQKLNSMLVLLTIAISGGPFIGLLGTVVGVMVTFAAIAATGDVNIAAIAPGMAAALLATVAGLGVAIPALFGYNYLSAKAKDINADMHVFSEEFVARLNELYGR